MFFVGLGIGLAVGAIIGAGVVVGAIVLASVLDTYEVPFMEPRAADKPYSALGHAAKSELVFSSDDGGTNAQDNVTYWERARTIGGDNGHE